MCVFGNCFLKTHWNCPMFDKYKINIQSYIYKKEIRGASSSDAQCAELWGSLQFDIYH